MVWWIDGWTLIFAIDIDTGSSSGITDTLLTEV